MLVGFVSAGLMSLSHEIGVILGADIGTTITAQIVAFKVDKYALILVAAGFLFVFIGTTQRLRQYGHLVMGLGLIFFGMALMSDGMRPLRDYQPFIDLMQNVDNPLIGILVSTLFTALIQSSSATMGVVIALAMQGLISLEGGIALALGANIGTCATAGLAAIGKPREAVRVAVAHVAFKVVGVLLIIGFIPQFAELVRAISPSGSDLVGMERLAAETPRQIANAHTLFNVGIAFAFLPFAGLFARFCEWLVPDGALQPVPVFEPRYLEDKLLSTPVLALDSARREIGHAGGVVQEMLNAILPAVISGSKESLRSIADTDEKVDVLHGHVAAYLGRIGQEQLSTSQTRELSGLIAAVNDLESMGDLIETDLVDIGLKRIDTGATVDERVQKTFDEIQKEVAAITDTALRAVVENDVAAARTVIGAKTRINALIDNAALALTKLLASGDRKKVSVYAIEVAILDKLKRIYYYAKRMAKTVPEAETEEPREVERFGGETPVESRA
jgi:phosphate:Na+ symporter